MRWKIKEFSASKAARLSKELGLHSIVAGVLTARGIEDAGSARHFITPSLDVEWTRPDDISGMSELVDRLEEAVRLKKSICIFGDYDVDGISASAIMCNTIKALGHKASVVLPLRSGEGYGLSETALERVYELEPDVVITVDCGISAGVEAEEINARGIELLITDHHEASGSIPQDVPVVDPKLDPQQPASILAGAGVALKVAAALGARFGEPELWKTQVDLATLGTVADCMPLIGENRALVYTGLKALNTRPRTALQIALETFGRNESTITTQTLSYGLIPRLNAAGRVSDPLVSFDLLSAEDPGRAQKLALKLDGLNNERKSLESTLYEQAIEQIEAQPDKQRVIVVGGECWHDGVKGIVASRLVREYGVPVVVFSFEDDLAIGSGRSVGAVDLHKAASELSDMFIKFGGHKSAIGLTIKKDRMTEFAARLQDAMLDVDPGEFEPPQEIDCVVGLELLSLEAVEELHILEPFGTDNPEPVFLTRAVMVKDARYIGKGEQHISLTLSDGARELSAVWFNAPISSLDALPMTADAVYRINIDEWRGRRKVKVHILDLASKDKPSQDHNQDATSKQNELEHLLYNGNQEALNTTLAGTFTDSTVALRKAQTKCLETLSEGKSTLSVMATGRGKSLIFQIHAAKLALQKGKPSLFIYPLKSLINDQEFHLKKSLGRLGLACASLTGSTPQSEREAIQRKVKEGLLSIVLSTPEFVLANANKLDLWNAFAFVVIDEAHHIATSGAHFRPDYTRLSHLQKMMPAADYLAVSATSDKATTDTIVKSLNIQSIVVDTSKRPNLLLDDLRNTCDRAAEILKIARSSEKSLIYTSSRSSTIELCRYLRKELREKAPRIAFYNAALTAEDRQKVEGALRSGELSCVVATSAFGEGVNIPDVRDVVLYDLPYSLIDFNQMAGRAGRDGHEAQVHILAHQDDLTNMLTYLQRNTQDSQDDPSTQDEYASSLQELKLFADWLFTTSPHGLLSSIQKPLTPLEELESS